MQVKNRQRKASRREQKEATRLRLLHAGLRLFATGGIVRTTTAEVARQAKVAHGTVFVHFPSREDLVTAVVEEFGVRMTDCVRQKMLQGDPTVREVLEAHVQAVEQFEAFYARLVTERTLLPEAARARLVILQSAVAWCVARAVERERAEGTFRELPPGLLFNTWLGLLHHYVCNPDLFAEGHSVLRERGRALVEHFMSLIRK